MNQQTRTLTLACALALPMIAADAALACGSEDYLGTVCITTYNYGCPAGTLPADGRQLPIQQYAALYSLMGSTFGGNGNTYFNLPDLRGRVIVGATNVPVPGAAAAPLPVGTKGGAETATLNANNLPAHTHSATSTGMSAAGNASLPVTASVKSNDVAGTLSAQAINKNETATAVGVPSATQNTVGKVANGLAAYRAFDAANAVGSPVAGNGSNVAVTGTAAGAVSLPVTGSVTVGPNPTNGTPVAVRDPYLSLNACIVTQGLYPQRP